MYFTFRVIHHMLSLRTSCMLSAITCSTHPPQDTSIAGASPFLNSVYSSMYVCVRKLFFSSYFRQLSIQYPSPSSMFSDNDHHPPQYEMTTCKSRRYTHTGAFFIRSVTLIVNICAQRISAYPFVVWRRRGCKSHLS